MAAPNPYQYLKHGILLCKKNFDTFVETFNFLVDFARNLRGDGEQNRDAIITVDRTVPDRPVICSKVNLSMLTGTGSVHPGCFEPRKATSTTTGGFDNPYYMVGGRLYDAGLQSAGFNYTSCYVVLVIDLSGSTPSASVMSKETIGEIQQLADTMTDGVFPLYEVDEDGEIAVDFRNIPQIVAQEFSA